MLDWVRSTLRTRLKNMEERIKRYLTQVRKEAIPQLSINCVIFGFHEKQLKVIVNKIAIGPGSICVLPGGYIRQDEDISVAVKRIVRESTGLEKILFRQFEVFGAASRSFRSEFELFFRGTSGRVDKKTLDWWTRRFVTICYLALVDFNKIKLRPTHFMDAAEWLSVSESETLSLDHDEIVNAARAALAKELPHLPVGANLLPAKFTLPELHALYEAISGQSVDRANFRRKILNSNMIIKVGQDDSGKRRPADLYRFKSEKTLLFGT